MDGYPAGATDQRPKIAYPPKKKAKNCKLNNPVRAGLCRWLTLVYSLWSKRKNTWNARVGGVAPSSTPVISLFVYLSRHMRVQLLQLAWHQPCMHLHLGSIVHGRPRSAAGGSLASFVLQLAS